MNMTVKPGYKQTEVGIIPQNWDLKRLGELASVTAGGTPSRVIAGYWNGDIPWITTSEIDFRSIQHAQQFITQEGLNNSAAKLLRPGTLLMALYGQGKTRGKVAILGIEAATNQACAAICFCRSVSSSFVFHFLSSQYENIRTLSNTGNQENLNSSLVRSIPIPLPTRAEQEAIAEALSDADDHIDSLEQLIAKKQQNKQGAMQELLTGKRRLRGFATAPGYSLSEIGPIPTDWSISPLGRLVRSVEYGSSAKSMADGRIPVLRMGNLQRGKITWDDLVFTNDTREINRYALQPDDVLFNRTNTIELVGKSAIYEGEQPAIFAGYLIRVNAIPELLNSRFLNYVLNAEFSRKHSAKVLSVAVGQANINGQKLKAYPIPLPPTKLEQDSIAAVLSDMDTEIAALEEKLTKARSIKQAMMQELLTGRVRLV